jgi:hypothetical protein
MENHNYNSCKGFKCQIHTQNIGNYKRRLLNTKRGMSADKSMADFSDELRGIIRNSNKIIIEIIIGSLNETKLEKDIRI